jgi:undecaprenyl-diphosphatase
MSYIVAIILGVVEGATEFIPISSTGHLILIRQFLHINDQNGLAFDAVLQLAAACALLVYFWKDIFGLISGGQKTLLQAIVVGTIPAIIFGLLLENQIETTFRNVSLVALTLVGGSLLMLYAEKKAKQNKMLSPGRGVAIGFFQCLALIPGISRSGATISGGLLAGLSKEEAVRFSFLLSLPILFGSGLKKLFDVREELFTATFGLPLFLGSVAAFVTGLIAITFLIKYLKTHNLYIFIWYRVILAILIFILV